jgi:hypothetical protein
MTTQVRDLLHLYEQDYSLWLEKTVSLLKNKDFEQLDLEHLIEEIEGLNKSDRCEIYNRLVVWFEPQLKLNYWHEELEQNRRGWQLTVNEQSRKIKRILKDSPSLKNYVKEIGNEAYRDALDNTILITDLRDRFPQQNPFELDF